MKKGLHIFCAVGWGICFVIALVFAIQGKEVPAMTAAWPTLVCMSHNIDKLVE